MRHLLLVSLLAGCSPVPACQPAIQLHVTSLQATERTTVPWNQGNDGFAFRCSLSQELAIQAGHYRTEDSIPGYNFFANYARVDYLPLQAAGLSNGVYAELVSGYAKYQITPDKKLTGVEQYPVSLGVGLASKLELGKFNVIGLVKTGLTGTGAAGVALEVGYTY